MLKIISLIQLFYGKGANILVSLHKCLIQGTNYFRNVIKDLFKITVNSLPFRFNKELRSLPRALAPSTSGTKNNK